MLLKATITAGAIALVFAIPASADDMSNMNMSGSGGAMHMNMSKSKGDQSPSSRAFAKANATMHKDMAIKYSGDADADFVRGMIPHHQGAIDMAKVELQYGKDPELKKMAEDIIKAQEAEIETMKAWLKKNGK
jgi:uncharacterized protein (DUF305 family)